MPSSNRSSFKNNNSSNSNNTTTTTTNNNNGAPFYFNTKNVNTIASKAQASANIAAAALTAFSQRASSVIGTSSPSSTSLSRQRSESTKRTGNMDQQTNIGSSNIGGNTSGINSTTTTTASSSSNSKTGKSSSNTSIFSSSSFLDLFR